MPLCVCGHSHTDGCPCGCSYPEEDLGGFGSPAGATNYSNPQNKYTGQYRGPYTLEETA